MTSMASYIEQCTKPGYAPITALRETSALPLLCLVENMTIKKALHSEMNCTQLVLGA